MGAQPVHEYVLTVTNPCIFRMQGLFVIKQRQQVRRLPGKHLALYAGMEVTGKIADPRHFPAIKGTAPTVESLGGKWAQDSDDGPILSAFIAVFLFNRSKYLIVAAMEL
ncbi:hypothetical protein ACI7RC_21620 [Brevibacillus sp. B_LB10_24]|uniref:hypothetical protein n=1 Tax=Brevibacillus sp. B_LB10_24 TaxID=3380645 RepID=UPI0038BCAB01